MDIMGIADNVDTALVRLARQPLLLGCFQLGAKQFLRGLALSISLLDRLLRGDAKPSTKFAFLHLLLSSPSDTFSHSLSVLT